MADEGKGGEPLSRGEAENPLCPRMEKLRIPSPLEGKV
jgi:hypothetical protein